MRMRHDYVGNACICRRVEQSLEGSAVIRVGIATLSTPRRYACVPVNVIGPGFGAVTTLRPGASFRATPT